MRLQALSVQCVIHLFQRPPWEFSAPNKWLHWAKQAPPKETERNVRKKGKAEGGEMFM